MSLLNDLKKVLFGAKSVAQQGAREASRRAKEASEELKHKSEEYKDRAKTEAERMEEELRNLGKESSERAKSALEGFAEKFREEADYAVGRGKELKQKAEEWLRQQEEKRSQSSFAAGFDTPDEPTDSTSPSNQSSSEGTDPYQDFFGEKDKEVPSETNDPSVPSGASEEPLDFESEVEGTAQKRAPRQPSEWEKKGDELLDKAAKTGQEAMKAAERAGKKLMDWGEEVGGKLFDKAEQLGSKLKEERDELYQRAKEAADQDEMDDTIRKAKEMEEQAAARKRAFDNRESERDTTDSTLSGTDSFFERAKRFAEGDYHNDGGKDMNIQSDPDYQPKERGNHIHGFEDRDGDGDDLIDDAILDEEDDQPKK